jgi:hypothetical protein
MGKLIERKGKGRPTTGHEGPEGMHKYSSTLSLTSALEGVGGQRYAPATPPPPPPPEARRPVCARRGGWGGDALPAPPPPPPPPEREPVRIVQEAGLALGSVWTDTENRGQSGGE